MIHMRAFSAAEETNIRHLVKLGIEHTLVQITATGFKKSILDATDPMRVYFSRFGIHDYSEQAQGPTHKVLKKARIFDEVGSLTTRMSLYRPITKKGDPRLWIYGLQTYCSPDDILCIFLHEDELCVFNLSRLNIPKIADSPIATPLQDVIHCKSRNTDSIADELTAQLRKIAQRWHPSEILADTGIGRTIESLLGIPMNASKAPDYKGIELKSFREKRPSIRKNLFTRVPDWNISRMKSSKEIVAVYGYMVNGHRTYHNTLRCTTVNSQGLGLSLLQAEQLLAMEEKHRSTFAKIADVAAWQLTDLHQALLSKHHETFWIEVESRLENEKEFFRLSQVEHTRNPLVSQFDLLLEQGLISVDLLLSRQTGGDTYSFKLAKKAAPLLFPEHRLIAL